MVTCYPNAYHLGDKILIQLTGQYHTPFALSIEDAKKLFKDLRDQIGEHDALADGDPLCICTSRRHNHEDGGKGRCKGGGCYCTRFELDYAVYEPYRYD